MKTYIKSRVTHSLTLLFLLTIIVACGGGGTNSPSSDIVSGFNTDNEGWGMFGDATSATPSHAATGGVNNSGYIFAKDQQASQVYLFQAPAKFLGGKGAYYGGSLSFYLKQQSALSRPFDSDDVVLEGAGITLVYNMPTNPGLEFSSFSVPLRAGSWKVSSLSGATATEAQLRSVLANLTVLRIRGEFETGEDTGSVDEVILSKTP